MKMTNEQIKSLLSVVNSTTDSELSCQGCQDLMADFVELELNGKTVPEALKSLEAHLLICPECTEELSFVRKAIGLDSE